MLTKRIIPCLDVKDGRVVKGIHFKNLKDAGDPVELGLRYNNQGADELIFLDITASARKRKTVKELAMRVAEKIFIPFTIGGGIQSTEDIKAILENGADKVALNTHAVLNPEIIKKGAEMFGSQCMVVAMDVKKVKRKWKVFIYGGTQETELEALSWARQVVQSGAGEILLTSMDRDGTNRGFDLEITRKISNSVPVPVIASGGGGELFHFREALQKGEADAVLAASVFHYGKFQIRELKEYLEEQNIRVRR
ncbi:MAG: imidazole glycerol phosphate synthase subunit HisF [bacterium]